MSFCRKCGVELPEDAAFCMRCGTQVVQPAQEHQPEQVCQMQCETPVQRLQSESQKSGLGFAIASMILGIIGLFYASFSFIGLIRELHLDAVLLAITTVGIMPMLALIFSTIARKRGWKNSLSKTGMITAIISFSFYAVAIFASVFSSIIEVFRNSIEYFV